MHITYTIHMVGFITNMNRIPILPRRRHRFCLCFGLLRSYEKDITKIFFCILPFSQFVPIIFLLDSYKLTWCEKILHEKLKIELLPYQLQRHFDSKSSVGDGDPLAIYLQRKVCVRRSMKHLTTLFVHSLHRILDSLLVQWLKHYHNLFYK